MIRAIRPGLNAISLQAAVIFLTLSGCSSVSPSYPGTAPIQASQRLAPAEYRVRRGDTLYAISVKFDKDYRELAKINKLGPHFRIHVGQRLKLTEAAGKMGKYSQSPASGAVSVLPKKQEGKEVNKGNPASHPGAVSGGKSASTAAVASDKMHWIWPVHGPVIQGYSARPLGNRGIDISGKRGEPVQAAAEGVVVYRGMGLVGYGRMLIIRHGERYLSVYAHNDRILVNEGTRVQAGQVVATLGSSGSDRDCLHFEIRVEGHPVDPLTLLPR